MGDCWRVDSPLIPYSLEIKACCDFSTNVATLRKLASVLIVGKRRDSSPFGDKSKYNERAFLNLELGRG